jgi:L-seryl-tRNA(Ser) seleniumtransferase
MGMLAAVEMWYKRDHAAEWKEWESWLATIADKAGKVQGVTTEVQKPSGLSNNTPQLRIRWDGARLGISGQEAFDLLLNQNPRINLAFSLEPVVRASRTARFRYLDDAPGRR